MAINLIWGFMYLSLATARVIRSKTKCIASWLRKVLPDFVQLNINNQPFKIWKTNSCIWQITQWTRLQKTIKKNPRQWTKSFAPTMAPNELWLLYLRNCSIWAWTLIRLSTISKSLAKGSCRCSQQWYLTKHSWKWMERIWTESLFKSLGLTFCWTKTTKPGSWK